MGLHPSLKQAGKRKKVRSVLSRSERIKDMIAKGKWDDDSKVFGLAKTKIVRMKIAKKVKKQEEKKEEKK